MRFLIVVAFVIAAINLTGGIAFAADPIARRDFEKGQDRVASGCASSTESEVCGFFKYISGVSGGAEASKTQW